MVQSAYGLAMQAVSLVFGAAGVGLLPQGRWILFSSPDPDRPDPIYANYDKVDWGGTLTLGGFLDAKDFRGQLQADSGKDLLMVYIIAAMACAGVFVIADLAAIVCNVAVKQEAGASRSLAAVSLVLRSVLVFAAAVLASAGCRFERDFGLPDTTGALHKLPLSVGVLSWAMASISLTVSFSFCVSEGYTFYCAACKPSTPPTFPQQPVQQEQMVVAPPPPPPPPTFEVVAPPPEEPGVAGPTPSAEETSTEAGPNSLEPTQPPESLAYPSGQDAVTKDETEEEETSKASLTY